MTIADSIKLMRNRLSRFIHGGPKVPQGHIPKRLLQDRLPPDSVIVEAGAHVGLDTVEMSRLWPKGIVHAFEPIPELYAQLERRTGQLGNVACYPLALAGRSGLLTMHVSSGASDGSSSLLPPKEHLLEHPDVRFDRSIGVCAITLDDWARQQGVDRVDLLWLDMQGGELDALKAGLGVLRTVKAIHTEVSLKEVYQGGSLYPEVRQWLAEQGFRVECEALPWSDMGNVLFVRSRE